MEKIIGGYHRDIENRILVERNIEYFIYDLNNDLYYVDRDPRFESIKNRQLRREDYFSKKESSATIYKSKKIAEAVMRDFEMRAEKFNMSTQEYKEMIAGLCVVKRIVSYEYDKCFVPLHKKGDEGWRSKNIYTRQ